MTAAISPGSFIDDGSSAIGSTLCDLGNECGSSASHKHQDGLSTSLLGVVRRMHRLFTRVPQSADNMHNIGRINAELTEVLKLVKMHQARKAEQTHHQGVGFTEIANALDGVETVIRFNLKDNDTKSPLDSDSLLSLSLQSQMQLLVIKRMQLYEEFHPEEYQTNGAVSMKSDGAVVTTPEDAFSDNIGPLRAIICQAKLVSTQGSVGAGNRLDGKNALLNAPMAQLVAKNGIYCDNAGNIGRVDLVGAEFTAGGTIFSGNRNIKAELFDERGNGLDDTMRE